MTYIGLQTTVLVGITHILIKGGYNSNGAIWRAIT